MLKKYTMWKLFGLLAIGLCSGAVWAADDMGADHTQALARAADLASLGAAARQSGVPILLMFSSEDCDYCERLESEVLRPMKLSGTDPRQVLVRKVNVESYEMLRDFGGSEVSAERLAARHNVQVYPTVALVDAEGSVLVPNIIGYQSPDFYGGYLDAAIGTSRQLMAQRAGQQNP
jgi:thioredoxin-related protein